MATRGIIGRFVREGGVEHPRFEGRYHHWDSYPGGLGATLYEAYQVYFHQNATAMMRFLIDQHSGWSSIVGTDFQNSPGYIDDPSDPRRNTHPQCYCHGARRELGYLYTSLSEAAHAGCEYAYIVNERLATMRIYHVNGNHWYIVKDIDLQGEPPLWETLNLF